MELKIVPSKPGVAKHFFPKESDIKHSKSYGHGHN